MGHVDDLADRYVDEWAPLNPTGATFVGIPGHDDKLDDLSPEGFEAQAELTRRTIAELDVIEPETEAEQVAKDAMLERLGLELARVRRRLRDQRDQRDHQRRCTACGWSST